MTEGAAHDVEHRPQVFLHQCVGDGYPGTNGCQAKGKMFKNP